MADYYVSPNGSDTANGNATTPFLTPIKGLNVVSAGDRLILREGIYRGNSGWFPGKATAGLPISIESYPDEKVVLTALSQITGWQPFDLTNGKAIYRAPMPFTMCGANTAIAGEDFVTCNGVPINEAQWPAVNPNHYPQKSTNWATVDSGAWITSPSTKNALVTVQIQDSALTVFSTNSLIGSRITLVPGARWTLVSGTVSANTGDKLTFSIKSPGGESFYTPDSRSLYFLFDHKTLLSPGSWWRDAENNFLYIWLSDSSNPNNSIIEAKKEGKILDFYARSYYKFKNLNFQGAPVSITNASDMKFDGCTFEWYSHRLYSDTTWGWINPAFYVNRDRIEIRNCNFINSFGNITALEPQQDLIIANCVIFNTGGVNLVGTNSKFLQNTVDSCPGGCFKLGGNVAGAEIAYNEFGHGGDTFTDGGLFLSDRKCVGPARIHRNYLHDGYAPSDGTKQFYGTAGFYLEHENYNLTFDHNIVCRTTSPGFNLIANSDAKKLENIYFYNNTCDGTIYWIPTWAGNPTYPGTRFINNYFNAQAANTGYHPDLQFTKNAFKVLPSFLGNTNNIATSNPDFDIDYQLGLNSPLKSIAQSIAGITTDPFPDIGAREGVKWTPGAIIRSIDIPLLAVSAYQVVEDRIVFAIANIPFGRHLGDDFKIKLGNGAEAAGTIAPYSKVAGRTVWSRVEGSNWVAIGQIAPPPTLQSLSSGAGLPGSMLSLFGEDYRSGSTVWSGDRQLATSYIDVDHLGITVPTDSAIGSLQLRVVNEDGQTSDTLSFSVLSSLTLTASSATVVTPGDQITLTGTGFAAGAIARFGTDTEVAINFGSSTAIGVQIPVLPAGATGVTVINPDAIESESLNLTIVLLPTIASFSPNPIRPGQELTVIGEKFGADPYLLVSGIVVIPIAFTDASLVAVVPENVPAGTVQIRVVSEEVGSSNPASLAVERPPALISAVPPSAPTGARIELTGFDLAVGSQIFFNETVGITPLFSGTTAFVTVPSMAIGAVALKVVSAQGLESAEIEFEVLPLPALYEINPGGAPVGGIVSILGENFAVGVQVFFAGLQMLTDVSRISDTEIEIVIPNRSPGTYTVRVENPDGGISTSVSFLVQGRPTVSGISVAKGLPGTVISISGAHFETGIQVRFKDTLLSAQLLGTSNLSFSVPVIAPESIELSVRNLTGLESDPISFEVLAVPVISSVSPASAIAGESILVSGEHFRPDIKLYLDSQEVAVTWESSTALRFEVPTQIAGNFSLRVFNAVDNLSSQLVGFTIFRKPAILGVVPAAAQPGSSIKISGTDLEDPIVLLGGSPISFARSGNSLSFTLPQYPPGTILPIRIRNSSNVLSEPTSLMVLPAIALNSISPPTSAPKTIVNLQGSFFPTDARVLFGAIEAQVLSVTSNTISVEVPNLPAIPTAVQVRTPAGAVSETIVPFDVLPSLVIFQITPNPAPSGTKVQIEGSGFNEGALVFVRSVEAIGTKRVSDSLIEITIPQLSPGPAQIRVVLPDDDRQTIFPFAVPSVWISAVSHTVVQIGEWLEITGTGFVQPIAVTIGGVVATEVIVISPTLLKARVPPILTSTV